MPLVVLMEVVLSVLSWLLLPQCRSEFPSQSRSRSSHPTHTTHILLMAEVVLLTGRALRLVGGFQGFMIGR